MTPFAGVCVRKICGASGTGPGGGVVVVVGSGGDVVVGSGGAVVVGSGGVVVVVGSGGAVVVGCGGAVVGGSGGAVVVGSGGGVVVAVGAAAVTANVASSCAFLCSASPGKATRMTCSPTVVAGTLTSATPEPFVEVEPTSTPSIDTVSAAPANGSAFLPGPLMTRTLPDTFEPAGTLE